MGQYWRLYNLDKRLYMDFSHGLFKLGELFFGNDPTRILYRLRSRGPSTRCWAGDRIICLGNYTEELPNGVLTNEELEIYPVGVQHILSAMHVKVKVPKNKDFDYSKYILRNLSKKEYIRGDNPPRSIAKLFRNSFGQTLFSRICWSDSRSAAIVHPSGVPAINRGKWAGDRFDITRVCKSVKYELEKDGWKDVSKRAKSDVEKIYNENGYYYR
ncbi:hypothetical protein BDQ17DRAFT_1420433 [Cyathus striatus]|nr:hypothetical protein BDQ17DRAFT_1420433 [Cyathus striatus]